MINLSRAAIFSANCVEFTENLWLEKINLNTTMIQYASKSLNQSSG
ncbi:hypothetical protein P20495_2982 [Pseudoalteromonas sp. BSi20495]|nr:hypothetical protein P20495_2982 [Pseudoalteromonas sp. BSi20495]